MNGELFNLTIHELHDLLREHKASSQEITEAVFKRIREVEPKIHSYVTVTEELAREQARRADEMIAKDGGAWQAMPLHGIPLGIKDNFLTEGIRTTCASKILHNFVPPYNGTAVQRLLDQGVVVVGKLNMDEFAMGSSNETSSFGEVRNPWDLGRIPGGSSGGSAAAVAAGACMAATGTDTGGSIRLPACLNNLVGLKPTYGRVSRFGIIAFASSLDQVGPIAKDVTDCAILMNALAGPDPHDSTCLNLPVPDYRRSLVPDVKGWCVGLPREYFGEGIDPEVRKALDEAMGVLQKLGVKCCWVSLPHTDYGIPTYYILATAEASSNLARYDGIRYGHRAAGASDLGSVYRRSRSDGFGAEVKRRIMLGTYVLSAGYYDAYYLRAQKVRTLIRRDFEKAFESCDVILTPVSPTPAWKIGEKVDDPLKMYLSDIFTINVNLAGLPGMSLPCGFTKSGLPIGMQLMGRHFEEEKIFRVAYAYEQATEWYKKRPKMF